MASSERAEGLKLMTRDSEPQVFDPVEFDTGFNVILGEKDQSSDKTNGVGKSMCVEFVNFALFKAKAYSRVRLIPEDVFNPDTKICLEIEVDGLLYTISRSPREAETPTISSGGEVIHFSKIDDATKFLGEKMFAQRTGS